MNNFIFGIILNYTVEQSFHEIEKVKMTKEMKTFLTAALLMATLLLFSPTTCRAQSESEQPEDWALENTASSCFFAPKCDLSSCTSDCVCYDKDCPGLSSCTENCQCDGGYCDLSSCVSGCQCYTGGCVMSAESEGDGPDSSCQRIAGGYGDPCTKKDGTVWVNPDQPPADTLPPGPAPVPSPPAEMDSTSASSLVVANSVLSAVILAGTIAYLLAY